MVMQSALLTAIPFLSPSHTLHLFARFPTMFCLFGLPQFSFSFVETHDISAVKIQLQAVAGWPEEESEEEESKTSPIIQSEGATCLWNIDGELVEMPNEVLVR